MNGKLYQNLILSAFLFGCIFTCLNQDVNNFLGDVQNSSFIEFNPPIPLRYRPFPSLYHPNNTQLYNSSINSTITISLSKFFLIYTQILGQIFIFYMIANCFGYPQNRNPFTNRGGSWFCKEDIRENEEEEDISEDEDEEEDISEDEDECEEEDISKDE